MPKRKYYRHILESHAGLRIGIKIIGGLVFLFFCSIMGVVFLFLFYAKDLPRPEKFTETPFIESSKISDRTGKIILAEIYGEEKRRVISLDTVPKHVKDAIIVTEDANFYTHKG